MIDSDNIVLVPISAAAGNNSEVLKSTVQAGKHTPRRTSDQLSQTVSSRSNSGNSLLSLSEADSDRRNSDPLQQNARPAKKTTSFTRLHRNDSCHIDRDFTVNKLRFSQAGICGREGEQRLLRETFDWTRRQVMPASRKANEGQSIGGSSSSSSTQMVLIAGSSGTGKSSLALDLKPHVEKVGGIFLSGKFDAHSVLPHRAFIFQRTDDEQQEVPVSSSTQLSEVIYDKDIIDLVEELNNVVSGLINVDVLSGTKDRVRYLVRGAISAIAARRPLVLFVDDLQWADSASIELLFSIINDKESLGLMVIGAYRDDSVAGSFWSEGMGQLKMAEDMGFVIVSRLSLSTLNLEAITDFLARLLSMEVDNVNSFAEIVHEKTSGNAFFVQQYLTALKEMDILTYNLGTLTWAWDIDRARNDTTVTANVADLLRNKLLELSPSIQRMLQVAACFGATFSASTIKHAVYNEDIVVLEEGKERFDMSSALARCVESKILRVTTVGARADSGDRDPVYCFEHDQVQQAAIDLIPVGEEMRLKYKVGRAILEGVSEQELGAIIYSVANLVNSGLEKIADCDSAFRARLAFLNLRAGKTALGVAAFEAACGYLQTGISLLGEDPWANQYDLALDLNSSLAEAQYCNGDFDLMTKTISPIIDQPSIKPTDKFRVNLLLADYFSAMNQSHKAIEHCKAILWKDFGVKLPKKVSKPVLNRQIIKTEMNLKGQDMETILALPPLQDTEKTNIMRLLLKLILMCGTSQREYAPIVVTKSMQITIDIVKCGFSSPYSAPSLAAYAGVLCGKLKSPKRGCRLGELALNLAEKYNIDEIITYTHAFYQAMVRHHERSIDVLCESCLDAHRLGMGSGAIYNAIFCLYMYSMNSLFTGRRLDLLEDEMNSHLQHMLDYNQIRVAKLVHFQLEFVRKMRGFYGYDVRADNFFEFKPFNVDDDDDAFILECKNSLIMMLLVYFGQYKSAWKLSSWAKMTHSGPLLPPRSYRSLLLDTITCFSFAQTSQNGVQKRLWAVRAKRRSKIANRWVDSGNPNAMHLAHLFDAERAALNSMDGRAHKSYDASISVAARNGWLHDRALANERAGTHFARRGDKYMSAYFLTKAYRLYMDWGALVKADQLKKMYPEHVESPNIRASMALSED